MIYFSESRIDIYPNLADTQKFWEEKSLLCREHLTSFSGGFFIVLEHLGLEFLKGLCW